MSTNPGAGSLADVLITDQLAGRAARPVDHAREAAGWLALAGEMAIPSRHVLHRIAEIARDRCDAGSAGISILEGEPGKQRFRWHALVGAMRDQIWGVTPRDFSPAGIAFDRGAPQLFQFPERHFRYFAEVQPQIAELLEVPFGANGELIGTLWVAMHDRARHVDPEELRVLAALASLAGVAHAQHEQLETERQASRHKDEFLAMLSHEMRNPIAAMSNSLRYLSATASPNVDQDRARAVIQRQLVQVTRLSEDLLDVSRIGRGVLELRTERTDLLAAIRLGREVASGTLAEFDRDIVLKLPDGPFIVDGDSARLAQIITNLLTNATRRTRSNGRVELSLFRDGDDAVVVVASSTDGIAAGWAQRRADQHLGGSQPQPMQQGIGLELARSLTQLHSGTASTVSVGGLTDNGFEVRFPMADRSPHTAVERVLPKRTRSIDGRRRERVLIVDDCVDSSDSLGMLLQSWGHEVRTAQGATAGLRLEWEFEPHAVILDIEMPGKNGYEVAAELRVRRRRDLLLIALSGHAREEDRARSLAAGFDHHMTKPANIELLEHILS